MTRYGLGLLFTMASFLGGSLQGAIPPLSARQNFNPGYNVENVINNAVQITSHSWEYSTLAEALVEYSNPEYSVFGSNPFGNSPANPLIRGLEYIRPQIRLNAETLFADNAVGDSSSLGTAALMIGKALNNNEYQEACRRQINWMYSQPKWQNGAISHRVETPSLWADFVYMAPPFIAYMGAVTNNATLLQDAVAQCRKYREALKDGGSSGLWKHIVGNFAPDGKLWSTGNAWAAGGMARVLATLQKSTISQGWTSEQNELKGYIKEILDGVNPSYLLQDGMLKNYLNLASSFNWWGEVAGTSLLAATAYRMNTIDPQMFGTKYFNWAEQMRQTIATKVNAGTGVVAPAINPLNWNDQSPVWTGSPEGQAFAVMLAAAYRDNMQAKA